MVHQLFDALLQPFQSRSHNIILVALNLLHLDGVDLRHNPLGRSAQLSDLLGGDSRLAAFSSQEFTGKMTPSSRRALTMT